MEHIQLVDPDYGPERGGLSGGHTVNVNVNVKYKQNAKCKGSTMQTKYIFVCIVEPRRNVNYLIAPFRNNLTYLLTYLLSMQPS